MDADYQPRHVSPDRGTHGQGLVIVEGLLSWLEKTMDAIYDIHHHMGLCNCEDPSVIVLPLSQL